MCLKFRLPGSVNCGYELFRMRECTCARHTVVRCSMKAQLIHFRLANGWYYVLFTIFEKIGKKKTSKFDYKQ